MPVAFDALVNGPILAAFGEATPARYTPRAGAAFDLPCVFDRHASRVTFSGGEDGVPTSVLAPQLYARLKDFPVGVTPAQFDAVTVGGAAYQVVDLQPDGLGAILLVLGNRA